MNNTNTSIRYVRPKDLATHLSVSISTIWRYAKRPDFPMPVKLSEKVTAF
ncbi:TPA: AlpA family phage regulatory protein, partial [Klebsiella pneumoniae]|nr:AlpA family phage regulatory protein [Klebsiella pneumoniae]